MTDKTNTPAEMEDTKLDEISGGPHFRNFHGTSFDFQAMPELDANLTTTTETESGHYTQMVWADTR